MRITSKDTPPDFSSKILLIYFPAFILEFGPYTTFDFISNSVSSSVSLSKVRTRINSMGIIPRTLGRHKKIPFDTTMRAAGRLIFVKEADMKRRRYHSMCLILFFGIAVTLLCGSISLGAQSEHEIAVNNFLQFVRSQKRVETAQFLKGNRLEPGKPEIMIGYLATLENGGHVLVSSSRDLTPIKSYSLEYDFDDMPMHYKNFLLKELEYRARTLPIQEAGRRRPQAVNENHERWDFLINGPHNLIRYSYAPGTHLLQTTWDQDPPFNAFMPKIGGQDTLVGCVPVALGQIMHYHQYPQSGQGKAAYEHNGEIWMAYLAKQIPWGIMPPDTHLDTPQYQKDAVGRFLRDLAFANHTRFGVFNSGTTLKMDAMIQNFAYSTGITSMTNADPNTFFATIRDQIDNGLPVLLGFHEPHASVIDGYSSNPAGREMHINFGWGGYHDGYYFLDQNIPAAPYTFTPDLTIYYNIKPCSGADCWANLESQDHVDGVCIEGQFDSNTDTDTYSIYCSGETALTGSAESVGAFYYGIHGGEIQQVTSNPFLMIESVPPQEYTVSASLCSDSECLDYLPESSGYTICVDSDTATSGMIHCTGQTQCHSGLESADAIQGISISGRFDTSKDSDTYEIYCTGQTTLEGSRGFSNQAFFIGIYDHDGMLIQESNESFFVDLPMGKYTVRSSLCNDAGTSCYTGYEDPYKDYQLTIRSGPLTQAHISQINESIEMPPVIDNDLQDVIVQNGSYLNIYIEAFDVNDEAVTLNASSNESWIDASFYPYNVLRITPNASHVGGVITVTATAGGETTTESFVVLTMDEVIRFGKEFTISGTFEDQDTHNLHQAILDGNCTISGFNGFSNQAFYIGVMDQDQNYIEQPTDNEISRHFNRGSYVLGASLRQDPQTKTGAYYPYQQGQGDRYEITVVCPDADDSIITIADEYGISIQLCNVEICNGEDDDCDGEIDEDGAVGCTRYYKDADGDGYGVTEESHCTCMREPFGDYTTIVSGDPNDLNPFERPDPEGMSVMVSIGFNRGWTMFSLPVIPADAREQNILPDAKAVFSFSGLYALLDPNDLIYFGKGYWVYHGAPKTYDITGEPVEEYAITDLPPGWSMIGGCSFPAYPSVENGRIRGLFGFSNRYVHLDPIQDPMEPVSGYWVNTSEQTTLTVGL